MSRPNANSIGDANEVGKITNEEEALEAVKGDGLALRYVPKKLKIKELCLTAVRQNSKALKYVPKELRDEISLLDTLEELGKYVIVDKDDSEI